MAASGRSKSGHKERAQSPLYSLSRFAPINRQDFPSTLQRIDAKNSSRCSSLNGCPDPVSFGIRTKLISASGWIGSGGGVQVEKPGKLGVGGNVAIAVGVVSGGAARGEFFTARGLRELPDSGVRNATRGWSRRMARNNAARRGRAGIVINKVGDLAACEMVANVVGGDDGDAVAFAGGHAGAVDAGAIAGAR